MAAEPLVYCQPAPARPRRVIACLCAEWCGTCRDYQLTLQDQSQRWPDDTFIWIDVEDGAELVGDLDIETFPTIIALDAQQLLFYGPVLPGGGPLSQLLKALDDNGAQPVAVDDDVLALVEALRARTTFAD